MRRASGGKRRLDLIQNKALRPVLRLAGLKARHGGLRGAQPLGERRLGFGKRLSQPEGSGDCSHDTTLSKTDKSCQSTLDKFFS